MKECQKVWIKGDKNRGKEVIESLETFGGINKVLLNGDMPCWIYFIAHNSSICCIDENLELAMFIKEYYQELTLPEEWKKGDIIISNDEQTFCVVAKTVTSESDVPIKLSVDSDGEYTYYEGMEYGVDYIERDDYRKATEDEIKIFHELMHHNNKDWDEKEGKLVDWHWTPDVGGSYYFIDSECNVHRSTYTYDYPSVLNRLQIGNCFKTSVEAEEKASEIKKLLKEL